MNKTALITGGTRGIGFGIAKALAQEGFDLALNGVRQEEQISSVLSDIRDLGVEVFYCQADISEAGDREKLVSSILDNLGQVNVLVNNAGVAPVDRNDLLVLSEESYDRVMTINLRGPFFLTQEIANHMVEWKKSDIEFSGVHNKYRFGFCIHGFYTTGRILHFEGWYEHDDAAVCGSSG